MLEYDRRSRILLTALLLTATSVLARPASSHERLLLAMDDMMSSGSTGANAQAQSGGMGNRRTMDDRMRDSSPGALQGMNQNSSSDGGGMMDNKMREMMRDHMRSMGSGMGSAAPGQSQAGSAGMPGMAAGAPRLDLTNRIEGRIAFLKAELLINDAQMPSWNRLADALRSSRSHLLLAREALKGAQGSGMDGLEQYERHLGERLEALRGARGALAQVYSTLNDSQKRTADELVVPLIEAF